MRRLDNRMKEAFDQVHASQELKARTRAQVLQLSLIHISEPTRH